MDVVEQMKKFIEPRSVALVGVPRRTGGLALNILENLLDYGYQGKLYPINPNATEILGIRAYSSVREVPEQVDLAVINLPRSLVPGILEECVERGIESIVIVTQGFADADDEEGKQLQKQIDDAIKGGKARILGPNTFGTANPHVRFNSAFAKVEMSEVPIGLVCQTGLFFEGLRDLSLLGKAIDLGNACDVGFADALEYFGQDDQTKVIGLHIEGMQDATRFFKVAKRVVPKKPVIALKTGRGEQAARAAQSHTGSLVGKDEIWNVAFKQSGIIRVSDLDEFADTLKAFCNLPLMQGRKIGIITMSGAVGIMGIDACDKFSLELAPLSPATRERINALSPSWQDLNNPTDYWPSVMVEKHPMPQVADTFVNTLLGDIGVDALLYTLVAMPLISIELQQLVERAGVDYPNKPFVFFAWGADFDEFKNKMEETGRTVVFPTPDRAIKALAHLADYAELRKKQSI